MEAQTVLSSVFSDDSLASVSVAGISTGSVSALVATVSSVFGTLVSGIVLTGVVSAVETGISTTKVSEVTRISPTGST